MTPRVVTARTCAFERVVELRPDGTVVVRPPGSTGSGAEAADLALTYLGHGRFRVQRGDATTLAYAVDDGDARWVFVDGEVFIVQVETAGARPRTRPPSGHETLSAPMPATVVRVHVAPGDRVARGTTLVALEAMKMELPLRATHDAVIVAVHCAEGDLVQAGVTLIELGAIPSAAS